MSAKSNKHTLRQTLKQQRQLLGNKQQAVFSRQLCKQSRQLPMLLNARRILSYISSKGEISPHFLTAQCLKARLYYPRISHFANKKMQFHQSGERLKNNRYGITEPDSAMPSLTAKEFDVVLLPLVAFDRQGHRLGMGSGFYDRAFSYKKHNRLARPYLIGIGYAFQEVEQLKVEPWDVILDAIITEQECIRLR